MQPMELSLAKMRWENMHKIFKDLQSQISSLSLKVEEERSQRIQIKAEYKTQLAEVTSKYELKLESILI